MRTEKLQNKDIIDKKLNIEDLEAVSGGAYVENQILRQALRLPEFGHTTKNYTQITSILKDEFNVRIKFEHGDDKNKYWDIKTGKPLTHLEVMKKIRAKYPREGDSE